MFYIWLSHTFNSLRGRQNSSLRKRITSRFQVVLPLKFHQETNASQGSEEIHPSARWFDHRENRFSSEETEVFSEHPRGYPGLDKSLVVKLKWTGQSEQNIAR